MAHEIERRFLLRDGNWRPPGEPVQLTQGFFKLGEQVQGRPSLRPTGPVFILNEQIEIPISWHFAWELRDICKDHNGLMPSGWKARIRCTNGQHYVFDLKGPRTGTTRLEFADTPLDPVTGSALLGLCGETRLTKLRFKVPHDGHMWDVDFYLDQHMGLNVAEVELPAADTPLELPDWVGEEITHRKLFGH